MDIRGLRGRSHALARRFARAIVATGGASGAYGPIAPLWTLPDGMYFNPETDLVEGTVWDNDHFRAPVPGGTAVYCDTVSQLHAAIAALQPGHNVILRAGVTYENVQAVFPAFATVTEPGQSRWWMGSEAIYNDTFPVAASRLMPWAGVTQSTPSSAFARINGAGNTQNSLGERVVFHFPNNANVGHGTIAGVFFGADNGPVWGSTNNPDTIRFGGQSSQSATQANPNGGRPRNLAEQPHYLCIDRCTFDGGAPATIGDETQTKSWGNFINCNAHYFAMHGSLFQNLYKKGAENKGFAGSLGAGRYKIIGCIFYDCGQIPMFLGGGRHYAPDYPTQNWETQYTASLYSMARVERSYAANAAGGSLGDRAGWGMKNCWENKQVARVLVQACIAKRSWTINGVAGQYGQAFSSKSTDQVSEFEVSEVDVPMQHMCSRDQIFRYIRTDQTRLGFIFSGRPDTYNGTASGVGRDVSPANRFTLTDVLCTRLNDDSVIREFSSTSPLAGGVVRLQGEDEVLAELAGPGDMHSVQMDRLTGVPSHHATMIQNIMGDPGWVVPMRNVTLRRSILEAMYDQSASLPSFYNGTGIPNVGDGAARLTQAWEAATSAVEENCWVSPKGGVTYPTTNGNRTVANRAAVGYRDPDNGDYGIQAGHQNEGRGCNVDRLNELTGPVEAKIAGL